MKWKKFFQILSVFCLFALLNGYVLNNEALVTINKISVKPEKLNTLIIFETSAPPTISETYYLKDTPSTIVLEFDNAETAEDFQISRGESLLVEDIRVEKIEDNDIHVLIDLKEQVPYRIYAEQEQTIVELNRIQRTLNGYIIDSATEEELKKWPKKQLLFREVGIFEEKDMVNVTARLDEKAIIQIFALENPLRLVVDFFHTLYPDPTFRYPLGKLDIQRVRTGQFETAPPYTIARLVFDLNRPKFYTLLSEKESFIFQFYKDEVARVAPAMVPPTPRPAPPAPPIPVEEVAPPVPTEVPVVPERVIEVPVRPVRPTVLEAPEVRYAGEIISMKFKDADLRDVILYLGHFAGLNVVFDPEVRGTVTCDLQDVPWDQTLDIILKLNKMGKTIEGNVLRIAPMAVLTREDEEQRKLEESKELAGPILIKVFDLSYAKAGDVESLLRTKISQRGEIIVDERTNTLIISDVVDRIDTLEKLIAVFDTPTPQVSIEARIVEATSTFVRNLGIQWGFRGIMDPLHGNQTSLKFPSDITVDGALIPQGISTRGIGGPLGGYAINLPAPAFNTAVGLSFGSVLDTFRLDMAISALETSGQGQIISSPTVTTQNNKQAEIIQGRQIPVQTVANFTTTTRFVNAALELRATPQITAEGTIIMDIEIRNNAADFANLVNGIPPITTQSATTTVMVRDGGTTVIGGIYRTEDSITRERVPFLHKIPILGSLFKNFARTRQKRELIIFITPRIIK
ncbi:MAG: type IV pilus secretin family protein [Candidatus Aminicenantes bacterium]|nr:MAG: type IV pilus secretin family protein [Candidatus Aminicenantes bacterium]